MGTEAYQPLRIAAHLRAGVVADRWLPLDGLLLYQACRAALGPQDVTTPGGGAVHPTNSVRKLAMPLVVRMAPSVVMMDCRATSPPAQGVTVSKMHFVGFGFAL